MKKFLPLPVMLILALVVAACGKSNDGPAPASVGSASAQPGPAAPSAVTSDLYNFCRDNLGTLTPDQLLCTFEINYSLGQERHQGVWNSPAYILQNDTVEIRHAGTPIPSVGNQDYSPGTMRFVSGFAGYLSFRGQSALNVYSVSDIRLKRCFNSRSSTVVCP